MLNRKAALYSGFPHVKKTRIAVSLARPIERKQAIGKAGNSPVASVVAEL
jgi:hypothetical protein